MQGMPSLLDQLDAIAKTEPPKKKHQFTYHKNIHVDRPSAEVIDEQVVRVIQEHPGIRIKDIAIELNMVYSWVSNSLTRLLQRKKILVKKCPYPRHYLIGM